MEGLEVKQDYAKAIEYFRKGAEANIPQSIFHLGYIFFLGLGVEKDYKKALSYFKKSVVRRFRAGNYYIGYALIYGKGVKIDYEKGEKLVRRSDYGRVRSTHVAYVIDQGIREESLSSGNVFTKYSVLSRQRRCIMGSKSNYDFYGTRDYTDEKIGDYVYWYVSGPEVSSSEGTIHSVTVDWSIDSNWLNDLIMILATPEGYISLGKPVKTGDDYLDGYDQTSDGSKTVTWNYGSPSNGVWGFGIKDTVDDRYNYYDEHRIDSVRITADYTDSKPDLGVYSITPDNFTVTKGDTFSFDYIIKNYGNAKAGSSKTGIYIDGKSSSHKLSGGSGYDYIGSISSGRTESDRNSFDTDNLSVGTHTLYIHADNYGVVSESNEINNWKHITFTVTEPSQADLGVYSASFSDKSVEIGENLSLTYTIKNYGNATSTSSVAGFYIDSLSNRVVTDHVSSMGAGRNQSDTVSISTSGLSAGTHTLYIVSDINSSVSESDESNNQKTIPFPSIPGILAASQASLSD
jgi:hypothetical protein